MKRFFFLLFSVFCFQFLSAQINEFELKVTFKPFRNQFIYLGYYYGKQKPIVDSVLLDDNSFGVFKRAKKMEKGVYLIGYPGKAGYFEILIDKEQEHLYPPIQIKIKQRLIYVKNITIWSMEIRYTNL